jgi:PHD/YefM family antitoxin component YafN of YafNO toxin-antitoxin module
MATKLKRSEPEIIVRKGKPPAVIVPFDEYRELLERLEDVDDLKMLNALRRKPLRFRKLEDFLKEHRKGV